MLNDVINEIEVLVEAGNLSVLQILWEEYYEKGLNYEYMFQHVYIHAAVMKQYAICEWMETIYETFDPVTQIAMAQTRAYVHFLLRQ